MKALFCVVFSLVINHEVQADSKLDPAFAYDQSDVDSAVYKYNIFRNQSHSESLDSALEASIDFKNDSPESLKKILRSFVPLPEIKQVGSTLNILDNPKQNIEISELNQGIIIVQGQKFPLRKFVNLEDAVNYFSSTQLSQSWYLNNFFPTNWIIPEAYAKSSKLKKTAITVGLFAFFMGLKNKVKEKKAEKALEHALANHLPLGPETLYGDTRAPAYTRRGMNPLQRIGSHLGMESGDDSDNSTYTPDQPISSALQNFLVRAPSHCRTEFNKAVFQTITQIQKDIVPKSGPKKKNGGYSTRQPGFNLPIQMGAHTISTGKDNSSHCASATYTAFTKSLNSYLKQNNCQISGEAASHFQPKGSANYGVYKIWDNDYRGPGDVAQYLNRATGDTQAFSKVHDPSLACPGDFVMFDRKKGPGHNVIFLGYQKNNRGGQDFCYWSSNSKTEGYGIQCEDSNRVQAYNILKVNKPMSVCQIKKGYDKNNRELNGSNLYSINYTGPEYAQSIQLAKKHHALLNASTEPSKDVSH